jgi:hypothetical protein
MGRARSGIQTRISNVKVLRFRPCEKNTLRAFFDLQLASGIVLRGCTLHLTCGRHWTGLPAKPFKTAGGADSWSPIVDFTDKTTRDRFQRQATAAALEAYKLAREEAVA